MELLQTCSNKLNKETSLSIVRKGNTLAKRSNKNWHRLTHMYKASKTQTISRHGGARRTLINDSKPCHI
eukprot:jgi/Botrbrau1/2205/Bobra.101_2s0035.1